MAASVRRLGKGIRKRHSRPRKHRFVDPINGIPTHNENLLYLLTELEDSIEGPAVEWSAELAAEVCRRLERLAQMVQQIALRGS